VGRRGAANRLGEATQAHHRAPGPSLASTSRPARRKQPPIRFSPARKGEQWSHGRAGGQDCPRSSAVVRRRARERKGHPLAHGTAPDACAARLARSDATKELGARALGWRHRRHEVASQEAHENQVHARAPSPRNLPGWDELIAVHFIGHMRAEAPGPISWRSHRRPAHPRPPPGPAQRGPAGLALGRGEK
jgi:hypothetical protein